MTAKVWGLVLRHNKLASIAAGALAALLLAGCGTTAPPAPRVEVVPVPVLSPPPAIPSECKSAPAPWPKLAEADLMIDAEKRSWVSGSAYLRAKGAHAAVARPKRICAAWAQRTDAEAPKPTTGPEQPGS